MAQSNELVMVSTFTQPARTLRHSGPFCYPYREVIGLKLEDETIGNLEANEEELSLPPEIANRLMSCALAMRRSGPYNCHRFTRVLAGLIAPSWDYKTQGPESEAHFAPPDMELTGLVSASAIQIGRIGIVGVTKPNLTNPRERIPHSFIGLEEESLQFTTFGGMLSIVNNADLLTYYQRHIRSTSVDLYQIDNNAFALPD